MWNEERRAVKTGKTVLVIDSTAGGRLEVKWLLEAAGYQVLLAPNSEVGLAQARTEAVDLITMETLLWPVDGWEVLRRLRDDPVTHDLPVVFVTLVEPPRRRQNLHADGYLLKPVRGEALLDLVARLLSGADKSAPNRSCAAPASG